jgi:glycogen operon protein
MLLAGDEFAQTQSGNNNAYNQDNETAWLDWQRAGRFTDLTEFVRSLVSLRALGGDQPISVYGVGPEPDLSSSSHSLAWSWGDLYVLANAWWEPLNFVVQSAGHFEVALTSSPEAPAIVDGCVTVQARSTVVLRRIEK